MTIMNKKMNKKLKIIFSISVLMNMLFIGIIIGNTSKHHWQKPHNQQKKIQQLVKLTKSLPESEQNSFQRRIESMLEKKRKDKQLLVSMRKEVFSILKSEPFNPSLYDNKIKAINELRQIRMMRNSALIRDMAELLPAKDRAKLAKSMMFGKKGRQAQSPPTQK